MATTESKVTKLAQQSETTEPTEPTEPTEEKKVKIKIPRTKENSADIYVSVNDRSWLIQRGVQVEVPECVAEVLQHQEEMLEESYLFDESVKSD